MSGSSSSLYILKDALGVFYFVAWSSTFYPQVLLNWKRRTTVGLSHDFMGMSWVGFFAYAVYTCGGFSSTIVRDAYVGERGVPPPIEAADVAFALHALVLATILLTQIIVYRPGIRIRRDVAAGCLATAAFVALACVGAGVRRLSWVSVLEFCGGVKVVTSIFKHIPQALSNFRRKSTTGFSTTMVIMDVFGSLGSFGQQFVRCLIDKSWEPFTGNLSKLTLSLESFLFDLFFLYQHFVLYGNRVEEGEVNPATYETIKTGTDLT